MVCFNTQPDGDVIAYHGHPKPIKVPNGVYRKSIALYYYTKEKPNNISPPNNIREIKTKIVVNDVIKVLDNV